MKRVFRPGVIAAVLLLASAPAFGAGYDAELDPVPFDATTRADVINSIGNVSASLDGSVLTIQGTFSGLTSPATGASLRLGLAKGVPGDAVGKLAADHAPSGAVSGSVTLTQDQVAALRKQSLYIRIDSQKAPEGNLQGWLEGK
jgi:hypothetical protein